MALARVADPQGADLVTLHRMDARRTTLGPADVQAARGELDLAPLQIAQLRSRQAMPIADQDHGRIDSSSNFSNASVSSLEKRKRLRLLSNLEKMLSCRS